MKNQETMNLEQIQDEIHQTMNDLNYCYRCLDDYSGYYEFDGDEVRIQATVRYHEPEYFDVAVVDIADYDSETYGDEISFDYGLSIEELTEMVKKLH